MQETKNIYAVQTLSNKELTTWPLSLLIISPWLCSYTSVPTSSFWPWLFSAFCAAILWVFRNSLNVECIASAWVLAAGISVIFGLLQYFGLAYALGPWVRDSNLGEAFGNLRQRNHFATLTSIGLVALIKVVAATETNSQLSVVKKVRWWGYATALLLAFGNAASNSRTGLFQWLLISILITWWVRPQKNRYYLLKFILTAMLSYAAAIIALPWLLTVLTGFHSDGLLGRFQEVPTCQSRKVLWSNVLTLIAQKPWLGWGWGELAYPHFITLYNGTRFCGILDNAHNLPLHLAVELGIPVALIICMSLGCMVWYIKPWAETDLVRQMAWAVLSVIILHSFLEYPLWYGPFQMAVGLCIGLLWTTSKKELSTNATTYGIFWKELKRTGFVAKNKSVIILTFIVTFLGVIGIDYDRVSDIYLLSPKESIVYHNGSERTVNNISLFKDQVNFAKLGVIELKPEVAFATYALALGLLHYSPEPRVIEKVIESAIMLGRDDEALFFLARYQGAFPDEYVLWVKAQLIL